MPKASVYEPRIVELLDKQPSSVSEVADAVGCTRQMAHRIVTRIGERNGDLTDTGGEVWQLRDGYPREPGRTVGKRVVAGYTRPPIVVQADGGGFQAGGTYTVQKVEVVEGRLVASLVDMAGARIDVEMDPVT